VHRKGVECQLDWCNNTAWRAEKWHECTSKYCTVGYLASSERVQCPMSSACKCCHHRRERTTREGHGDFSARALGYNFSFLLILQSSTRGKFRVSTRIQEYPHSGLAHFHLSTHWVEGHHVDHRCCDACDCFLRPRAGPTKRRVRDRSQVVTYPFPSSSFCLSMSMEAFWLTWHHFASIVKAPTMSVPQLQPPTSALCLRTWCAPPPLLCVRG
jgi:hypothetical protein